MKKKAKSSSDLFIKITSKIEVKGIAISINSPLHSFFSLISPISSVVMKLITTVDKMKKREIKRPMLYYL